jgi:predicted phosphodiesterase
MSIEDWTSRLALDTDTATPVLVFGGPYSNLGATRALQAEAARRGIPPHRVVCTGDVVAYCAEPEATVAAVRAWGCHVIAGNCEEQLAAAAGDCGCGFEAGTACDLLAKGWYPFANQRLSEASRLWMRGLPGAARFTWGGVSFRLVHGGVDVVNAFVFASDVARIDEELARAEADVVLAGHAGIPFIARRRRGVWFNAGAIGMPANDGTSDVWYGLISPTPKGLELSLARLAYDHHAAAASMRRWAYADSYARSLVTGIWPSFDVLPDAETAAAGIRLRPRSGVVPWPKQRVAAE